MAEFRAGHARTRRSSSRRWSSAGLPDPVRRARRLRARAATSRTSARRFDAYVTRVAPPRARRPRSCASRRCCRASRSRTLGYLETFPHLAGSVFALRGHRGATPARWPRRAGAPRGLERLQHQTDLVPDPGRLLPGLPGDRAPRAAAARRRDDRRGRRPTCSATSRPATRRGCRCSTMRELVRIGEPEAVQPGATTWRDRALDAAARRSASTPSSTSPPTRSSAAPGRMLAVRQREQALKFEVLVPIAGPSRPRSRRSTTTRTTSPGSTGSRRPTAASRTRRAWASGSSASRSRCSARTASTSAAWPADGARRSCGGVIAPARRLDPAAYVAARGPPAGAATYPETNCYTDIARRAAARARPRAAGRARASLVRMDFEGDQWTFFKPPQGDLERLFGVDIHEMQPCGRCPTRSPSSSPPAARMIVELDSWFLPDTAATDYRREHVKTTVAIEAIDRDGERLRYFHNAGLLRARGEDYRGVFRSTALRRAAAALHRAGALRRRPAAGRATALRAGGARRCCATTCAPRPRDNPFARFGAAAGARPARPAGGRRRRTTTPTRSRPCGWSGSALRAAGVARRLAARRRRRRGERAAMREIVEGCKVLSFRLARRRAFDPAPRDRGDLGRGVGAGDGRARMPRWPEQDWARRSSALGGFDAVAGADASRGARFDARRRATARWSSTGSRRCCDVVLNGEVVARSESMFVAREVDVPARAARGAQRLESAAAR